MNKKKFQENIIKSSSKNFNKIIKFCEPLKTHLGIDYFFYYKLTKDGYFSIITNNLKFNEFFFGNDYHLYWPYVRDYKFLNKEIKFFSHLKNQIIDTVLNIAVEKFELNLIMQITDKNPKMVEGFCFGSSNDNKLMTDVCLNEMNLLHLFAKQFKNNFSYEICEMDNYQVNMKEELGSTFSTNLLIMPDQFSSRNAFLTKMGFESNENLSCRELEVLEYLLKGFTAGETANQLFLSKRTVESHIENIKNKLNCFSKIELIEKGKFIIPFILY